MRMVTCVFGGTDVPAAGFCPITSPSFAGLTVLITVTGTGTRPRFPRVAPAAVAVMPTRRGTCTFGGAFATVNVTVDPCGALPDAGDCATTIPTGAVLLAFLTTATLKPRSWSSGLAWD